MKLMKIFALVYLTSLTYFINAQHQVHDTSVERLNTDGKEGIFLPVEDLEWITAFEGGDIQFSLVSGSTFKTPHSTFSKFPGNFITPPHTHAHSYQAVVISGVMINPMGDEVPEKAKKMRPGSYWYVPANEVHTTGCISKEPCVFYMHQPVPFNFEPVEETKQKIIKKSEN